MNRPMLESDLARRRRDRVLEAVESVDGVIAADVDFTDDGAVERIRVAIRPGALPHLIRPAVVQHLQRVGVEVGQESVRVRAMVGRADGPAEGRSEPTPPRRPESPPPPRTPPSAPPRAEPAEAPRLELIEEDSPPPPWHGRFLVLDGVDVVRRENRVTCTVRLTRLGESFSAEVDDIDTATSRARCAARAAVLAAERAGEGIRLSLEGVTIQEFFGREYVIAFVDAAADRRLASLSGILAVDHSLETAAVLAVLRAVERWVAW